MTDNMLLDTIDQLTKPYTASNWMHDEDGDRIVRVEQDGLLKQLRTAIIGGIGSHAGSSSGSERIPFDTGALELYQSIEKTIGEWFVDVTRKPVYLELETTLRQWYIAFTATDRDETLERSRLMRLRGWVAAIEAKFDPPRTLELTVNKYTPRMDDNGPVVNSAGVAEAEVKRDRRGNPVLDANHREQKIVHSRNLAHCPKCGNSDAYDPKTGDKRPALILEYRELANETIDGSKATCRACGHEWVGGQGVRELSWLIQREEDQLNTPEKKVSSEITTL